MLYNIYVFLLKIVCIKVVSHQNKSIAKEKVYIMYSPFQNSQLRRVELRVKYNSTISQNLRITLFGAAGTRSYVLDL